MRLITVKAEIQIPKVPNFIMYAILEGSVAIGRLTDDELREIGAAWTDALLERAETQRKNWTDAQLGEMEP